eukprot:CAMPEP_0178528086 /NCGR_PEP_ID=MMETSP0696-20121128/31619_1 /TAXON_ID=265572 /ORGANISM="Extubocellulus spinifer, Strain CCMP396" /LENGTH=33 /DNA_ID= /DNA_START= /DNA_END= /DNA_ORIENTATION=
MSNLDESLRTKNLELMVKIRENSPQMPARGETL